MTRKDAENLYGWLSSSYPRNYRDADARLVATTVDNLTKVFEHCTFQEVYEEYQRTFAHQKNEPHPSEVLSEIRRSKRETRKAEAQADPYEVLKANPKYAEIANAYGERATRRAAKLCTRTATIKELLFHLEHDIPCREGDFLHKRSH